MVVNPMGQAAGNAMKEEQALDKKVEHLGQIAVQIVKMVPSEKKELCSQLIKELVQGVLMGAPGHVEI